MQVCSDWDKPFDLTDDEKAQFRQHVPYTVTGLEDVLCAQPHAAEVGGAVHSWRLLVVLTAEKTAVKACSDSQFRQ